jgi:four helix bundle protein
MSYYKNMKIWQNARQAVLDIHAMTFEKLPKFESREEGRQIRQSIKAVKSQIVEGFGRRRYKQEFIRYLTYASASCDTTIDHLENLSENGSLKDRATVDKIYENLTILAKQINGFIKSVEKGPKDKRNHETSKPDKMS